MIKTGISLAVLFVSLIASARGQETIFNVPSGDILEKGKAYGELDYTYQHSSAMHSFTPRIVAGVGGRAEIGANINGLTTAVPVQTTISPTVKWKAYDGGANGWAFLLGDDIFIPVQNRSYSVGNYVYAEFTKTLHSGTRFTFGGFHFSCDVIAAAHRAGGQFGFEQPLKKRVIFATDWFTGAHALGYVTPGVIVKLGPKLTGYASYQIGNHDTTSGNHQLLMEIGWKPQLTRYIEGSGTTRCIDDAFQRSSPGSKRYPTHGSVTM